MSVDDDKNKKLQNDKNLVLKFFQDNFSYVPEDLKSGENSVSFRYQDNRIRFPRKESSLQDYEKEAYVTHYIKAQSPKLPVPLVEIKEKNGQKFSVHQEMKGKTLISRLAENEDNIHFESLSATEKKGLANDVGRFLAELHNIPLAEADENLLKSKQMGLQAEDTADYMEKFKSLYAAKNIEYNPVQINKNDLVLSHNDFHGGNFILDEDNKFKGAIDFGEAGINYRFKDFMPLYSGCGRAFIRDVVHSYNELSQVKMTMKELDFHYLNKMAEFNAYVQKPEYALQAPKLQEAFNKGIRDYQKDKSLETQKGLQKKARSISELRGLSHQVKTPVKPQKINLNSNTLKLYNGKRQNI